MVVTTVANTLALMHSQCIFEQPVVHIMLITPKNILHQFHQRCQLYIVFQLPTHFVLLHGSDLLIWYHLCLELHLGMLQLILLTSMRNMPASSSDQILNTLILLNYKAYTI